MQVRWPLEAERHHLGTKINTLGDAFWWSICTVTTVGYGDESPVTGEGRLIAALLMIGGIGLIGTVTATIASWIVQRVAQEDSENQTERAEQIEALRDDFRRQMKGIRGEIGQLTEIALSQQSPPRTQSDIESMGDGRSAMPSQESSATDRETVQDRRKPGAP